uniref:Resolvase HTH domain-containing protein n=1 Tax=uncultured prokaryote TaxID=198431 RepID=A0A0H5PXW1_9ZZZZ|nr:hypothetical protein [uncultured prokaryote]
MIKWLLGGFFMWFEKIKSWREKKKIYPVKSIGRPRLPVDENAIHEAYLKGVSIAEIARQNNCSETTVRRRLGI